MEDFSNKYDQSMRLFTRSKLFHYHNLKCFPVVQKSLSRGGAKCGIAMEYEATFKKTMFLKNS